GGILIESVISRDPINQSPQWQWAIAGIGININQTLFSPGLLNPVSLKQITGKNFDCIKLAKELCSIIDSKFKLLRQEGFGKIHDEYLLNLYKLNEKVRLKKGNRNFEALIKTVTPQGRLWVEHAVEEDFGFGEVEWVI
ncbi:MAG TPA: biotin--[acetyl-CoA-carboxylase] ligase, partial [Chitinophagaceae bacterium]|nr:biotin--[acetyl-CoA-carboxylase] ligase [Chitinophagaceae bacterium]